MRKYKLAAGETGCSLHAVKMRTAPSASRLIDHPEILPHVHVIILQSSIVIKVELDAHCGLVI